MTGGETRFVVVQPRRGWLDLDPRDLWEYRELLYFFVWRDVKVRYKQTALGAAWAVIPPLMTMVVFSLFFGRLAGVPSDGRPYPIFAYAGLVPWTYFSNALSNAANSLVANQHVIGKVYFPRLLVPLAGVLTPLLDLGISFLVLLALLAWYGAGPSAAVLWLPFFVALAVAGALGVGLWLAALNVAYRDVRHVLPFLSQLWLFATPVAYPASLVPEGWRVVYALNPMVAVVEGFRWALLGTPPPGAVLGVSGAVVIALLAGGYAYFRHAEGTLADLL